MWAGSWPAQHMKLALFLAALASSLCAQSPLTLWYRQPANLWVEALPVGNGRLGAMVFGGVAHERIQFNESTVWTGEPHDYAHHGAYQSLRQDPRTAVGRQAEGSRRSRHAGVHERPDPPEGLPGARRSGTRLSRRLRGGGRRITAATSTWTPASPPSSSRSAARQYRREVFADYPSNVIVVRLTRWATSRRV